MIHVEPLASGRAVFEGGYGVPWVKKEMYGVFGDLTTVRDAGLFEQAGDAL